MQVEIVHDNLRLMAVSMQGAPAITDTVSELWLKAFEEEGLTPEQVAEAAKYFSRTNVKFPSLIQFINKALGRKATKAKPEAKEEVEDVPSAYFTYDCQCRRCKAIYAVKTTQSYWTCGYCNENQATDNTRLAAGPGGAELTKEGVKAICKSIKALFSGTELQQVTEDKPQYDKAVETRRLVKLLEPVKLGADNGNEADRATLAKWRSWIIKSSAEAIRSAANEIENKRRPAASLNTIGGN